MLPCHGLLGIPFGRLTRSAVLAIRDAAATVAMPPFRLGFDRVESFRHDVHRPLVLRGGDDTIVGAAMLQSELVAALRKIGFARRKEAFTPHMTLLYDARHLGEQAIEEASWTVREFALVCSLRGRHRHVTLARWPLRG